MDEKILSNGKIDLGRIYLETDDIKPKLENITTAIVENGDYTISPSEGFDGIEKVDLSVNVAGSDYSKYGYDYVPIVTEQLPIMDEIQESWDSSQTSGYRKFYDRQDIIIFPLIDTSNLTSITQMFRDCTRLVDIPVLDFSNVAGSSNHNQVFSYCYHLSKSAINNILLMCSRMTKVTSNKTLSYLGVSYSNSYLGDITQYSNYQAFIDAGWTL